MFEQMEEKQLVLDILKGTYQCYGQLVVDKAIGKMAWGEWEGYQATDYQDCFITVVDGLVMVDNGGITVEMRGDEITVDNVVEAIAECRRNPPE